MAIHHRLLKNFWLTFRWGVWLGLGCWTILAVCFTAPVPSWAATLLAVGIGTVYALGLRANFGRRGELSSHQQQKYSTFAALTATVVVAVCYFGFRTPNPNQDWIPEHARMPSIRVDGDKIHVQNVRSFKWHSDTDFTRTFRDRTYDLNAIDSMYLVVASLSKMEGVAHVFLCFSFTDGQDVAVSVEARRIKDRPYRSLPALFRQYQLIYVIGEEQDVVGLRGAIWKERVYVYPLRTSKDMVRSIFADMMRRAHTLKTHPEFYNFLTNNCMNNITYHLRRLTAASLLLDMRVLLSGLSARVAYDEGYIDTTLPFAEARRRFRMDQWMQNTKLDEGFSQRLRTSLSEQTAGQVVGGI